jgi:hypothetical protein
MEDKTKNGLQCAEFDALLSDVLDEKLSGAKLEGFQAHAKVCTVCGPLMADVDAGKNWLKALEEIEPPDLLIENILVATTGIDSYRLRSRATGRSQSSWLGRIRNWGDVMMCPIVAMARQPRFAMSFGMAFFSLSISLSLAGVKLSDIRHVDLRPTAIKRNYYETSGKVVKYYENIRFVYEIESRVREFKRATTPAETSPAKKDKQRKDNSKQEPEQKQERNYSQGENQPVLAWAPNNQPVVTLNADRRLS